MRHGPRGSSWVHRALIAFTITFGLSCTRMPTAPRIHVTVEGRVSGSSGELLQGAEVYFHPGETVWTGDESVVTDSLGLYTVTLLSGAYAVSVYPPNGYGAPVHGDRVTFSSSHGRYDYRFQGFRVTGRVTGPTGAPVIGGFVTAQGPAASRGGALSPLTNGSYSLLLPAGTYSFEARDGDYLSGLPERLITDVAISADTTIDIELAGAPVSGHVTGPDGLPLGGVRVRAVPSDVQTNTQTDGSYLLYPLPGTYRVWFLPPPPYYIFPRITDPMLVDGPITIDGDLSGVEWTGTVRRSGTGEPAADVPIFVTQEGDGFYRSASIKSGPQGEFRFVLEPDRSYDLKTYDPGTSLWTTRLQGVAATADTTFEILVP